MAGLIGRFLINAALAKTGEYVREIVTRMYAFVQRDYTGGGGDDKFEILQSYWSRAMKQVM